MNEEEDREYSLVCPFWIDTEAYSYRDKNMFVAGYEFADILRIIREIDEETHKPIHRENESRIRMACGRFGRVCHIEPVDTEGDPEGIWSYLTIEAKS